jgi:hypothetical protein
MRAIDYTLVGARNTTRRIGATTAEVLARKANGERWCSPGRHWFCPPSPGYQGRCRECQRDEYARRHGRAA